MILPPEFYRRDTLTVAKELLGSVVVSRAGGAEVRGVIVETEAYCGSIDPAAHSYRGRTDRVRALYDGKGLAYIYLIYGMYWCLNFSAGPEDRPDCVLIRALEPVGGLDEMARRRRAVKPEALCSGPGKLCMALGIDRALYGARLFDPASPLTVEAGYPVPEPLATPRIGIDYAGEARNWPWRFTVPGNRFVSTPPRRGGLPEKP